MFEMHFETNEPDIDSYYEFLDLYADMYQGGRKGVTKLPMLIFKHPYVIEKERGIKLRISKKAIASFFEFIFLLILMVLTIKLD